MKELIQRNHNFSRRINRIEKHQNSYKVCREGGFVWVPRSLHLDEAFQDEKYEYFRHAEEKAIQREAEKQLKV